MKITATRNDDRRVYCEDYNPPFYTDQRDIYLFDTGEYATARLAPSVRAYWLSDKRGEKIGEATDEMVALMETLPLYEYRLLDKF